MKTYLISLISAALLVALVNILSPDGGKNGISGHVKLLTSLFLVCVIITPLATFVKKLQQTDPEDLFPSDFYSPESSELESEWQSAIDQASTAYFGELLTQSLQKEFSIEEGSVRCVIVWEQASGNEALTPTRVTVILSGKAIWQAPKPIQEYVTSLLGCECNIAIE